MFRLQKDLVTLTATSGAHAGHEADLEDVVVVGREGEFAFIRVFPINEVLPLGVDDHQVDGLIGLRRHVVLAGDQHALVNFLLEALPAVGLQVEHQGRGRGREDEDEEAKTFLHNDDDFQLH